ncbi:STARD5 isoform 3 [Pongo abelii]|uniref:STARD5 isoform 3 n=1 Tax=Pongo abelii TaxID=9601 RepID=A0A2J8SKQ4_PONAB|nr:STARD5 isoform 3 [Pongo abelii]
MDPALAAQMSEAVAEKMLQYRRDAAGWKICREGVPRRRHCIWDTRGGVGLCEASCWRPTSEVG